MVVGCGQAAAEIINVNTAKAANSRLAANERRKRFTAVSRE